MLNVNCETNSNLFKVYHMIINIIKTLTFESKPLFSMGECTIEMRCVYFLNENVNELSRNKYECGFSLFI